MTSTGWTGDAPASAPMPLTAQLLRNRARGPGDTLAMAAARSRADDVRQAREAAEQVRDPDEAAAILVNRGTRRGS